MAEILGIGTSALLSLQKALSTTGHNIANVNTEGYNRQRVEFTTLPPQLSGSGFIGNGVQITTVRRAYDDFIAGQVLSQTASQSSLDAYVSLANRLDNLLASGSSGLSPSLQQFFDSIQAVAANPSGLPERQVMLAEAQALADRFAFLDRSLVGLETEVNNRLTVMVDEINGLAFNIAKLNQEITVATGTAGGQPPNDLLDQRDLLLTQLSKKIGITTVGLADGSVNVMIGTGQPLVVGGSAQPITTVASALDPNRLEIGIKTPNGGTAVISQFISGGEISGVMDFRARVLDPARNELGRLAAVVTDTFNTQHRLGMDSNGQMGGDFFTPLSPVTVAATGNTGTATVAVTVTDARALAASDYRLNYDGSQWLVTRIADNKIVTGSGPFNLDGLTIAVSGTPALGDSFLVRPVHNAAGAFAVALTDVSRIAIAAPVRASANVVNTGTATIADVTVQSITGLPLAGPISLTFNPNALGAGVPGFDVSGGPGGPLAFDPVLDSNGKTFTLSGFGDMRFTVRGSPQAGDSLVLEHNSGGRGDNRNGLLLAGLQTQRLVNNGASTFGEAYGAMVADVGVKTRQGQANLNTQNILLQQAVDARESVSGVNLDEEAARLLRLQQAYQAAARIVAVADNLFQTLLEATRR